MKTLKAILVSLVLTSSSLLWGATERQQAFITQLNALLESKEEAYSLPEWSLHFNTIDYAIEEEDLDFLPVYESSDTWLQDFAETELETTLVYAESHPKPTRSIPITLSDGRILRVALLDHSHAYQYIRIISKISSKGITLPRIDAIGLLNQGEATYFVIIHQIKNKGGD